ncbi:MAG TPA: hypothetical protein VJP80_07115 [Candidatus Saccharimonadales bacterium]|nr:hypothetical protein [Candidatus Saccharimonadales bacterium]
MKKPLVALFVVLAIVFVALAVYYWMTPAGSLPHGFPGYEAGSAHKHLKHGLAALLLGAGCGVLAWFASGKKDGAGAPPAQA